MKLSSFIVYVGGLAINVVGLVLSRYFDRFESYPPNDGSGEIIRFLELVLEEMVVDCLR